MVLLLTELFRISGSKKITLPFPKFFFHVALRFVPYRVGTVTFIPRLNLQSQPSLLRMKGQEVFKESASVPAAVLFLEDVLTHRDCHMYALQI